jgi:hypothetical protein
MAGPDQAIHAFAFRGDVRNRDAARRRASPLIDPRYLRFFSVGFRIQRMR